MPRLLFISPVATAMEVEIEMFLIRLKLYIMSKPQPAFVLHQILSAYEGLRMRFTDACYAMNSHDSQEKTC